MKKNLVYILLVFLFASCGEYQKLMKSNDYQLMYKKAVEYYNKGDYQRAQSIFESIRSVFTGTSKAQSIAYYRAFCSYNERDYESAAELFKQFVALYPNSPYTEECVYMIAFSDYKASPRPRLDQTVTQRALDGFQNYLERYPNSSRVEQILVYVNELKDKLSYKSFLSASNYYIREHYKAAVISLDNCVKDYPNSKYREEVLNMLFNAKYYLAVNSIDEKQLDRYNAALEEYFYFVEEFPSSKFIPDMKKKYQSIDAFIKNYKFED